jgi:hypothetical protein
MDTVADLGEKHVVGSLFRVLLAKIGDEVHDRRGGVGMVTGFD